MSYSKINNLPKYALGDVAKKVHEIRLSGKDIIDLSQLNPSLPPPQIALDVLVQASLKPSNHRYSSSSGINTLRESISKYYQWKFNAEVNPHSELVVTSGTKEGIFHLLMSMTNPGESILVPVPAYPVHTAAAALVGVSFIGVPLWENYDQLISCDGVLSSDSDYFFEGLSSRFSQTWPRPKVILTSFPHNPTTTIVTKCFYERLVDFSVKNNCIIINDFAHGDIYYDNQDIVSLLSIPNANKVSVELYSLSKGFSLAGWRVGAALGNSELISSLKSLKSYTDFGIFQPIQIAAAKLLEHEIQADSYIKDAVSIYKYRRELIVDSLKDLGLKVLKPKATPFVWASLPQNSKFKSGVEFCTEVLESKNVAFFPGSGFDSSQTSTLRISLTENESRLRDAMSRLTSILSFILFFFTMTQQVSFAEEDCPKALTLVKKAHVAAFSKEEIKKGLDEAIKLCPHMVEAVYEYGRYYLNEGKFDQAEQKFKEADQLKPRVEHALGIALSQSLRKDFGASENTYKQALTTYLGHWSLLEGLAVLYLELNKLSEAEELLRQALQSESSVDSIYYNLGLVLEKQGRVEEAQTSYRTALEKNEKCTPASISLIRLLNRSGNYSEAIRFADKALLHSPNNENILFVLSDVYSNSGDFSAAENQLHKIQSELNKSKRDSTIYLIQIRKGKVSEASKSLEQLYESNNKDIAVSRNYGLSLVLNKNYEKAEKVLTKVLEVMPSDPAILNNLGTVYEGMGQIDKAKDFYNRAQSISSYKVIQENIERLR